MLLRTLILIGSTVIACVWADALLFVAQETTEVVLATEDLEALVAEPAEQLVPQSGTEGGPLIAPTDETAVPLVQEPPAIEDTPLPASAEAESASKSSAADRNRLAESQVETAPPLVPTPVEPDLGFGQSGTLTSLDGSDIPSDSPSQAEGPGGRGGGPVWDIQFRG
ncbi:MAG: hypothetical protein ABI614_29565, partial [Planctomycetota bacterium]